MPDELFRASHFHNSAPNSNIVGHAPLMCKHNVVYDLLPLVSI